jgi:hypothetical protein
MRAVANRQRKPPVISGFNVLALEKRSVGILENWNVGKLRNPSFPYSIIPLFHFSIIPGTDTADTRCSATSIAAFPLDPRPSSPHRQRIVMRARRTTAKRA